MFSGLLQFTSCVNHILEQSGIGVKFVTQVGPNAQRPTYIAVGGSIQAPILFDAGTPDAVLKWSGTYMCEDEDPGGRIAKIFDSIVQAILMPAGTNRVDNFQNAFTALYPGERIKILTLEIDKVEEFLEPVHGGSDNIVNESILSFNLLITYDKLQ